MRFFLARPFPLLVRLARALGPFHFEKKHTRRNRQRGRSLSLTVACLLMLGCSMLSSLFCTFVRSFVRSSVLLAPSFLLFANQNHYTHGWLIVCFLAPLSWPLPARKEKGGASLRGVCLCCVGGCRPRFLLVGSLHKKVIHTHAATMQNFGVAQPAAASYGWEGGCCRYQALVP